MQDEQKSNGITVAPENQRASVPPQLLPAADPLLATRYGDMSYFKGLQPDHIMNQMMAFSMGIRDSAFLPEHVRGNVSSVFYLVHVGYDLGLKWTHAVRALFMTPGGRLGMEANIIAALLFQHKFKVELLTDPNDQVKQAYKITRPDGSFSFSREITWEFAWEQGWPKAKDGGVKPPWKDRANMLRRRSLAFTGREVAPDLLGGLLLPEEAQEIEMERVGKNEYASVEQVVDDIAENDPALKIAVKSIEAPATGNVINMPTGAKQPEPAQTALPPRDAKLEEFFEKPAFIPSPTIFHRPPPPPPATAAATETGVTDDDLPEENGTMDPEAEAAAAWEAHQAFMSRLHAFCGNHEITNEKAVMTWLVDDAGTTKEMNAAKRAELINKSFSKLDELAKKDPSVVEGFKKTKAAAKAKSEGKPDPIAEEFPKWGPETCDQARKVMAQYRMTAGKFLDVLKSNGFRDMPEEEARVGLELYGRHLGLLMGVKMAWQKNVPPSKLKQLLNFHCPDGKSLDKCEPGEMMSAMAGAMGELQ